MPLKIEVQDEARNDLWDGFDFYEKQHSGLGSYFLRSLRRDIDQLQDEGGIHRVIRGYHRLQSRRFPFSIYYKMEAGVVKIHAIIDSRRDPDFIINRLR